MNRKTFLRKALITICISTLATFVTIIVVLEMVPGLIEEPEAYCKKVIEIRDDLDKANYEATDIASLYFVPKPNSAHFPFERFHDKAYPLKKEEGIKRIIVLGDSISQNMDHEYTKGKESFHEIAERKLNADGQQKWEVINAGVQKYNTVQQYLYYQHFLKKYEPDIVVLQYVEYNDYEPPRVPEFHQSIEKCIQDCVPNLLNLESSRHTFWINESKSYVFFAKRIYNLLGRFDRVSYPPVFYKSKRAMEYMKENREAFWQLEDELRKEGIPLFVIVFPMLCDKVDRDQWLYKKVKERFPAKRINYLYEDYMADKKLTTLRYIEDDFVHPNTKGHEFAGEAMYELIVNYFKKK